MIAFNKNLILSILSFFAILISYCIEYYLQIIPCFLCLLTRNLFIILFIISICYNVFIFNNICKKYHQFLLIIIKILLLSVLLISIYHILVEYGVLSSSCGVNMDYKVLGNVNDIKKALEEDQSAPCNVSYKIFDVSLVLISFFYILFLNVYYFIYKKTLNYYK